MTNEDLMKTVQGALASPNENISRDVMGMAGLRPDLIEKAITTNTGLVAYDLQAPAKNLYPVNTPIIKSLPRIPGAIGKASNWVQISALAGSGHDASGWVPEGQRAGQMSYTSANKSVNYATLGEEDQASWEAISGGRTFEDVQAMMTVRLLQKMMLKEESAVIGGNASVPLGTPATPTVSSSGTGSTLGSATYSVIVVALTYEGYRNSSLAAGVATAKTITGADGKTFIVNGGSSNKSAAASQSVTSPAPLLCSATYIPGTVAYAWFVGLSGSEKLERITTLNSTVFSAALAGTGQAATLITADASTNATAFDGLLTAALKSGSGAYVNTLAIGTVGTGTVLTSSGKGSVNEIDTMLQNMWDNYQVSPSILWMNSQELKNVTTKVLSNGSAPLLQYFKDPGTGEVHVTAGATVDYYFNPFLNGGTKMPIKVHPNVPAGTILAYANDLPIQYQNNEVPNVAEMKVRRDYYQVDWPVTTRAQMVGVYAEEALAIYAPFALGVINNIANG